ncbi:MAG: peptidoglycan DD-metalloendopeptidase family protein [Gammaproteobacteria bacterium]|nr:peptidoglycan DD-metalloendopeptidase family protein [Gammaproteobacteria bacterium]
MQELINSFPRRHKILLAATLMFLCLLVLWPAEQATAQRNTEALVVANYQQLAIGQVYPLPLTLSPSDETLEQEFTETHQVVIKSGDNLADIFKRVGQPQKTMLEIARSNTLAKKFTKLIPGKYLTFETDSQDNLVSLRYEENPLSTVVAQRLEDGNYETIIEAKDKETKSTYFEGEIKSSFWNAGVDAGLNENLIMNFTNIFQWDVDFALDIREGDKFYALVERIYIEGEFVGYGDILAAEFINQDEAFKAVRFEDGRYYTDNGDSMQKAFLRAPVNFKYISSNFTNRRFHPVQKRYKAHRGVDYAARTGTPVVAAGDGKVIRSSYDKYNGHHVFIEHGGGITTKYIHFSKRKVKRGQKVRQGQLIGLVGQTGLAAGPHLHYEFLVNGVHRNPRTVSLPKANPIPAADKERFLTYAEQRMQQLAHNKQLLLAMR